MYHIMLQLEIVKTNCVGTVQLKFIKYYLIKIMSGFPAELISTIHILCTASANNALYDRKISCVGVCLVQFISINL